MWDNNENKVIGYKDYMLSTWSNFPLMGSIVISANQGHFKARLFISRSH